MNVIVYFLRKQAATRPLHGRIRGSPPPHADTAVDSAHRSFLLHPVRWFPWQPCLICQGHSSSILSPQGKQRERKAYLNLLIELLRAGMPKKDIAELLGISETPAYVNSPIYEMPISLRTRRLTCFVCADATRSATQQPPRSCRNGQKGGYDAYARAI